MMSERISIMPESESIYDDDLTYDPSETEVLTEDTYFNTFGATSPNGQYTVCGIDKLSAVAFFDNTALTYEKSLTGPYHMAVSDEGVVVVCGFTEGGYQDGQCMLYVWDSDGTTRLEQELRAVVESVKIDSNGRYAAIHTGESLVSQGSQTDWDFSIYTLDLATNSFLTRYTGQIPGVEAPGPRRMQIQNFEFVNAGDTTAIALFEQRDGTLGQDVSTVAEVSEDIPVVDVSGNLIQRGRPDIDAHPDHYQLTAEAKEWLQ